MLKCLKILTLTAIFYQTPFAIGQLVFESGERQVSLIELYSSEGCSSCPPADRRLAKLRQNKRLFKDFVPIEFHVDYWNYLGWTDPFSNKQFSKRQRTYAGEWGNGRVYTPGFVVNGTEHSLGQAIPVTKTSSQPGNLKVTQDKSGVFKIEFTPKEASTSDLLIHGVILGNGLATKVPAGENAGETLKHEFVVLKHKKSLLKKGKAKTLKASVKLPKPSGAKAKSYSVAFWVSKKNSQAPIQATGGNL